MADLLRRTLAPITDAAWAEIDAQATKILKGNLSARAVVDMNGPQGWELGAVNLGRVEAGKGEPVKGVGWGLRQVLPLMEVRAAFDLNVADLDMIARGGKTPELGAVIQAAQRMALCEEQSVYRGFKPAGITGMLEATRNEAVTLPKDASALAKAVEEGVHRIQAQGIGGPYDLVLGRQAYRMLAAGAEQGYPMKARVLDLLGGGVIRWTPALNGGAVVSRRGGDFELTLGQDLSIGYAGHEGETIHLYVTESFTFRVLEPAAAVELKTQS